MSHYCALLDDGTVRCWGSNARGQLGFGEVDGALSPTAGPQPGQVEGLTNVMQIAATSSTTCAVIQGGVVKCWGDNSTAGLGTVVGGWGEDTAPHATPLAVPLPGPAVRVDPASTSQPAYTTFCATLATGELWCWGANLGATGLLARSTLSAEDLAGPGLADRLMPFGALRFGVGAASLVLTADEHILEWGIISGRDTVANAATAYPIALTLDHVTHVSSSDSHACAITNGHVECWAHVSSGYDVYACNGTGPGQTVTLPVLALTQGSARPQQIAVGHSTAGTCVRMTDGTVQCCGDNVNGGLGTGDEESSMVFTPAKALAGYAVHVAASQDSKCALLKSGQVECWGGNTNGELGQWTMDTAPHPVPLAVALP
jgi:alpha-tubulin suppressor-like RCC1 family protein